jgi:hypothetical protein
MNILKIDIMNDINKKIMRLAEINAANTMIGLGDDLIEERQVIVDALIMKGKIELSTIKKGDFDFVGKDAQINKNLYLETFDWF